MSSGKVVQKKQKLLIDGHYFIKLKDLKNSTKWCCDKKGTLKCKSIVKTRIVDGSYDIKVGPTEHNHEDPQNRTLIVATPRKSIIGIKSKKKKYTCLELDFEETSTPTKHEHEDVENKTNITDGSQKTGVKRKWDIPYVDKPIEPDFGVKEIKFVKWPGLKHEKLYIDGFYFSIKNMGVSICEWECSKVVHNTKCPVRFTTVFSSGAHKLKSAPDLRPHIHDKSDIPINLKKFISATENNVENIALTQGMCDVNASVEFPPPIDCEIKVAILFGLRRQMVPVQIFYELQSVYGLDAPSFEVVSEHCKRFQSGNYPPIDTEYRHRQSDMHSMSVSKINDDLNMSREVLVVQPDMNISNVL